MTRGDGERFFSFVVTHSAFELTAIVLSGAAGLKLGHAVLAPGRLTRTQALMRAARETSPVVFCFFAMLVIAAAIEAFWSSAGWIAPGVKYAVGGCCWALVFAYLGLQGRRHDAPPAARRRAMKAEQLQLALRPRPAYEAVDLGVRMTQRGAPLAAARLPAAGAAAGGGLRRDDRDRAVAAVDCCCGGSSPGWTARCCDIYARQAFGEETRFDDAWEARRSAPWLTDAARG